MKKLGIIIFFLFVFLHKTNAQLQEHLHEFWRWEHFDQNHGLLNKHTSGVFLTPTDQVWIKSPHYVSWYDGYEWKNIVIPELSDNPNCSCFVGETDSFFIITKGLLFEINKTSYTRKACYFNNKKLYLVYGLSYSKNEILVLANLQENSLATNSLYIIDKNTGKARSFQTNFYMGEAYISTIFVKDKLGYVWLCVGNKLYKGKNNYWDLQVEFPTNQPLVMHSLSCDCNGNGYFSITSPESLFGTWYFSEHKKPKRVLPDDILAYPIAFMPDCTSGIAMLVGTKMKILQNGAFSEMQRMPAELEQALSYCIDKKGVLWVATPDGVNICRLKENRWDRLFIPTGELNNINELFKANDGTIWCGTGNGIAIIKSDSIIKRIPRINNKNIFGVTAINQDPQGNMWIASGGFFPGAYKFDGKEWKQYLSSKEEGVVQVHKIFKDSKGRLWFLCLPENTNTDPNSIFLYENGKFTRFGEQHGLNRINMYSFAETKDGALWFGTRYGLIRYKNNKWRRWTAKDGLIDKEIYSIAADKQDRVWFCNRHSGVGYIENDVPKYIPDFANHDILIVWNLTFDQDGTLWMACANGLYSYSNKQIYYFGKSSGLGNIRVWPLLPEGEKLYVGAMVGGLYILNRKHIMYPSPRIVLMPPTQVKGSVLFQWNIFSYLGSTFSNDVEIRYKIDNDEWSKWQNLKQIQINDIPGGKHTFYLQAKDLFGKFNPEPASIVFHVELPLYLRTEFMLSAITGIVLFIATLVLHRKNKQRKLTNRIIKEKNAALTESKKMLESQNEQIQRQNSELRVLNATKDKFFSILAHDLINPFNAMLVYSKLLSESYSDFSDEEKIQMIDDINTAANRLFDLLNNLMQWATNQTKTHAFQPTMFVLNKAAVESIMLMKFNADNKNIQILNQIPDEMTVYADYNMIFTVFRNLISNAIKFTPKGGMVTLYAAKNSHATEVTVKDSGVGISKENIAKLFRLDENLKTKGTEMESGTGLGLILCNEFIQKHNGKIKIESEIGKGTSIIFTLNNSTLPMQ